MNWTVDLVWTEKILFSFISKCRRSLEHQDGSTIEDNIHSLVNPSGSNNCLSGLLSKDIDFQSPRYNIQV